MTHVLQDVRFALRWLRRSPGFAVVAVASVAIAIGIHSAVFAVIDSVLFRPIPVRAPERLVSMYTSGSDGEPWNTSSYADLMDLRSRNNVFEDMAGHSAMVVALNPGGRSRLALGEIVTGNYFQVLGVAAARGRTLLPDDDRPGADRVVMISHRYWQRELGAAHDTVGRTLRMRGQSYSIVGIAPAGFTGLTPLLSPDLWVATAHAAEVEPAGIIDVVPSPGARTRLDRRGYRWLFVKARLKNGVTIEQARANVDVLVENLGREHPQTNRDRRASIVPARSVRLHPAADAPLKAAAAGLMLAVGLVLLVACANVAGMLLARASARHKELSVRLALGASRGRLVQQLVTESVVISTLGAVAGLVVAWWIMRSAASFELPIPIPVTLDLRIDSRVFLFTVGASLLGGILAGLVPALRASGTELTSALKGGTGARRTGRVRWTLRDSLVAGQMAVSLVLLVAAGLLGRSLVAMQAADAGFTTGGLAILSSDPALLRYDDARARQFHEQAVERVRALPGVRSVALAARLPFSLNFNVEQLHVPGVPSRDGRGFAIQNTRVSPEYFSTLGIPILEGRAFTAADTPESPRVLIVNETLARRFFPNGSAIGKRLHLRTPDGPAFEIVGVSADYKVQTLSESPQPYAHFAQTQQFNSHQVMIARTEGDPAQLLRDMRRELLALEPDLVFVESQTMAGQIAATLFPARATAWLVSLVGAVGVLLAAVGLYGVTSYSVTRRTREIGTRMALGAQRRQVLSLVMRRGFGVSVVGAIAGFAIAAVGARFLSAVLYGVGAADPIAWTISAVVLFTTSVLANVVPALRATRINPTDALRAE